MKTITKKTRAFSIKRKAFGKHFYCNFFFWPFPCNFHGGSGENFKLHIVQAVAGASERSTKRDETKAKA